MRMRRTAGVAALAAGLVATTAFGMGTTAQAAGPGGGPVQVVGGLSGPFGLDTFRGGFVVGESSGGDHPGQVTWIDKKGQKHVLFDDAPIAGVTAGALRVWSVTGEEAPPPDAAEQPQNNLRALRKGPYPFSSVLKTHVKKGQTTVLADLMQYELDHNPDGQAQFDEHGNPYDALSNPFAITKYWKGLLVADGGANDVLLVNPRSGKVSTFFVPPTVKGEEVPECAGDVNNTPDTQGCDPVPTGVTVHGKSVYVSTLGGEAPGGGKIYKLDARNGNVQRVWTGLDGPTGVAVGPDGSIYYSQVFGGGEGGPPGRVNRIVPNGDQTYVDVPMPVGLTTRGSHLYATTWALGDPGQGQVVELPASAFHAPVVD